MNSGELEYADAKDLMVKRRDQERRERSKSKSPGGKFPVAPSTDTGKDTGHDGDDDDDDLGPKRPVGARRRILDSDDDDEEELDPADKEAKKALKRMRPMGWRSQLSFMRSEGLEHFVTGTDLILVSKDDLEKKVDALKPKIRAVIEAEEALTKGMES